MSGTSPGASREGQPRATTAALPRSPAREPSPPAAPTRRPPRTRSSTGCPLRGSRWRSQVAPRAGGAVVRGCHLLLRSSCSPSCWPPRSGVVPGRVVSDAVLCLNFDHLPSRRTWSVRTSTPVPRRAGHAAAGRGVFSPLQWESGAGGRSSPGSRPDGNLYRPLVLRRQPASTNGRLGQRSSAERTAARVRPLGLWKTLGSDSLVLASAWLGRRSLREVTQWRAEVQRVKDREAEAQRLRDERAAASQRWDRERRAAREDERRAYWDE